MRTARGLTAEAVREHASRTLGVHASGSGDRFNDVGRSVAEHRAELDDPVARVLDSGWFVLGPEGDAFEHEFAGACGAAYAVGVASRTDAIELALRPGSGREMRSSRRRTPACRRLRRSSSARCSATLRPTSLNRITGAACMDAECTACVLAHR